MNMNYSAVIEPNVESVPQHPDDAAVDRFAAAIKEKLAQARAKGRGGWDNPARAASKRWRECLLSMWPRVIREI